MVIIDDLREVAIVIVFAKTRGIEIAIRGGGHAKSGSSSTEGGICIDLSRLRKVILDPNTKTVTAQGGALWADVDKAAEEHGLAVVGGTVNTTGVGGLTLGGGYGYLVGEYGLVIDNWCLLMGRLSPPPGSRTVNCSGLFEQPVLHSGRF